MSMFDKAKEKLQEFAGQHPDKVDQGVDKAADVADEKTGGKYGEQIDKGADKVKDHFSGDDEQQPPQ
ncbi:antitoxin [Amycolatopsis sp. NPDC051903]|uniref:antitoxin n=1 Tax=Amycolatopsis sp. NPDC051903 TaxID=3363936 RepID=UPI0037BCEE3D